MFIHSLPIKRKVPLSPPTLGHPNNQLPFPCEKEGMLAYIDNVTIKVPSESVDVYKSAWSEYASIIESR